MSKKKKSKDMLINFGRSTSSPGMAKLNGADIEMTADHKYLGTN